MSVFNSHIEQISFILDENTSIGVLVIMKNDVIFEDSL